MKVENELSTINEEDVDMLNEQIVKVVRGGMDSVCPKIDPVKKKEPWEDDTLKELLKELHNSSDHRQMRKLQKRVKRKRCKLKNEYFKQLADNINTVAEARNTEKEFALAKKYNALKTVSKRAISNEKLKTHFEQHFAQREIPIPPEIEKPDQYPYLADEIIPVDESPPTVEEVKKVLKNFKNNKSAGTDKLKTEGLKYNDSKNLITAILTLMTLIWTFVKVPSVWWLCSIMCLFKKGLMSLAVNYRGISIGANMSRILAKLIMDRLKSAYETHIGKEQFGFRQNRSTSDAIFITKMVIEKCQGTLIAVYIDLTAAYNHVPRDLLFKVLTMRTGATHLIAILKKMYEGTTASIRGMETTFDVLIRCRQGGQESPCIFNFYFDYVLKVAATEIDKAFPDGWGIPFQYNIPHCCTNRSQRNNGKMRGLEIIRWILYADDVVLFCRTVKEAEMILNILNDTCRRFGLTISFKKTKTQVFNNEELAKQDTLFTIGSEKIENVCSFVYLGQGITNDPSSCFTQYRIERAIGKFYELKAVLCDTNVNLRTRRKILESCVRSRLTYGTSAWFPNEREMKKLEGCWNHFLRNMVKGGWKRQNVPEREDEEEEADYAFIYTNEQIESILKTTPLRNFVYSQYLKYVGHICREENTALTKILLFAKPERRFYRDPWGKIAELLGVSSDQAKRTTQSRNEFAELIRRRFNSPL